MANTVIGLNGAGGCEAATTLTGARAVDTASVVRLVTDTFITICGEGPRVRASAAIGSERRGAFYRGRDGFYAEVLPGPETMDGFGWRRTDPGHETAVGMPDSWHEKDGKLADKVKTNENKKPRTSQNNNPAFAPRET